MVALELGVELGDQAAVGLEHPPPGGELAVREQSIAWLRHHTEGNSACSVNYLI